MDWAGLLCRTFPLDVCVMYEGRRRVLAYPTASGGLLGILEHVELPSLPPNRAPAQRSPQLAGC